MTEAASRPKRMRKPRLCDACLSAPWPAFGVGCPGSARDAPPEVRSVYLWHCGAPACEADCRARFAAKLREIGRFDLAAKVLGETFRPVAEAPSSPSSPSSPGAVKVARRLSKPRLVAPVAGQGALFGV